MINPIENKQIPNIQTTDKSFRPGQVVQGKVLKLYPGQKAQVRLGNTQLVAQLQAPLSLGASYHFQVDKVTDTVYLRVLGEQLKFKEEENINQLLKQLGMSPSKAASSFVKHLIRKQIPFDRAQFMQAIQLLQKADKKSIASDVLSEMIRRKLPMTPSVFQALTQARNNPLGNQLNQLIQVLQQENTASPLLAQLKQFTGEASNGKALLTQQFVTENYQRPAFFLLLKASGLIPPSVDFQTWKSNWQHASTGNTTKWPYQLDSKKAMQVLEKIVHNKTVLKNEAERFIQQWGALVKQSASQNLPLTYQQKEQISKQIGQILSHIGTNNGVANLLPSVNMNDSVLREAFAFLQSLTNQQTYKQVNQLLNLLMTSGETSAHPKEQLLHQVKLTLSSFGLSYEHDLLHEKYSEPTLKQLLLEYVQKNDGPVKNRAVQLLHLINGLQLNSLEETNNFVRATLLLPGEKMQLNSDLKLEFEGKKTEKGEISSDYCRILFYLTLSNLKETVVDMNVQKRNVQITVYINSNIQNAIVERFKPLLKSGLAEINYQLSGITFKPLAEKEQSQPKQITIGTPDFAQGVDFRI